MVPEKKLILHFFIISGFISSLPIYKSTYPLLTKIQIFVLSYLFLPVNPDKNLVEHIQPTLIVSSFENNSEFATWL